MFYKKHYGKILKTKTEKEKNGMTNTETEKKASADSFILRCSDVSLSYDGRTVLSGLDFQLGSGDYLCVVGENGSGKSTLVRAVLGLKEPDTGKISFGEGLSRRDIGYLPQQHAASGIAADFPANVREIVLSGCIGRHGMFFSYSAADKKRADESCERLGISDLKTRSWKQLSGGQRQRVLLARALCAADRLLLLDEPVAGLDPLVTAELYGHIKKLNKEGMTIIMVSHDIEAALRDATHILHLHNKPLYFGAADRYRDSEAGKHFIGGCEGASL